MSERATVRARRRADGTIERVMADGTTRPLVSRTDWQRLAGMTDEEIEANARADPDNPPLTTDELARLLPVPDG